MRTTVLTRILDQDEYAEVGLLYGRRSIETDRSLSYSIGISYNQTYFYNFNYGIQKNTFVGIPFEFNIKWFDSEKEPIRILGIFPVSKPFAFGASEGFKIQGNISKNSYVALGLVLGFGFHKHY
ncbi:MAG: hypothetical protein EOP43_05630 [Sphingobacteriaceae bacterium]|nr:MAG: hypothetical protein EOP43_05630 [Sphingobacteriaceae bacterium]